MKKYRLFRRMRERAYKDGYLDAMVDHTIAASQTGHGHRPPPGRNAHAFEDPFLPSDWAKIDPEGGAHI